MVRELANNDLHATVLAFFNCNGGSHFHRATPCAVRIHDSGTAENACTGREIGSLNEGHQIVRRRVGVIDDVNHRVDNFAKIMRRNIGGHANSDALAAINQQVREPGREHHWLFGSAVVVRHHVDGVFVDVGQQLHRQRIEPTLGVTRSCRPKIG